MTEYSKTDCTRFEDDLKAYADGELPWLRRAALRRHLTHCASCQEEIAAMTQISEDLRSSEPADALPSSLREKILTDVPLASNNGGTGKETEGLSSGSPIIGSSQERSGLKGGGASPRNRRLPAWTFAAVAVVAWLVFYPMFQQVHESARRVSPVAAFPAPTAAEVPQSQREITVLKRPPPPKAPSYVVNGITPAPERFALPAASRPSPSTPPQVRLSNPEAGIDANAKSRVVYGNFGPRSLSVNGNSNSLDSIANADPDSLRQVHKEASIGLQVPDPEATGDTLNQMVQETGGYVVANNLTTGDNGLRSGELIVKVPEPQFETFLAAVAKLGIVVSKNVTGQDITEKTSDAHEAQSVEESDLTQAEARLKALGTHAKWEDTQNAEDLRVQLAQTRARLKLLKRLAALGTLTIDLSQTPKAAAVPPVTGGFTSTLKATTHDALQSLVGSAGALLALIIWLLAYAPLWVPLLLLGRYALKEYRKREAA